MRSDSHTFNVIPDQVILRGTVPDVSYKHAVEAAARAAHGGRDYAADAAEADAADALALALVMVQELRNPLGPASKRV